MKVKGNVLLARKAFVTKHFGADAWGRVLDAIPPEDKTQLDCLTVVGWCKEALKMCGAKTASVKEEECRASGGSACRYRVSWT